MMQIFFTGSLCIRSLLNFLFLTVCTLFFMISPGSGVLNLRAKRPPGLPGLSSRVQSFNITIRRSLNSFHTANSMPTARRNIATTAETYSNNTLPYSRQSSSSTNSEEQRLRRAL
jgi:hypothetical protein